MIVKVFIKEKEPSSDDIRYLRRVLEQIIHEGYAVEFIDPDTPLGKGVAEAYDVVAPSVLILREGGQVVQEWRGKVPKNPGDIRYYLGHQISKVNPSKTFVTLKRGKPIKPSTGEKKPSIIPKFAAKKERTTIKRKEDK